MSTEHGLMVSAASALWVCAVQLFIIQQVLKRIADVLERIAAGKRAVKVDVLR